MNHTLKATGLGTPIHVLVLGSRGSRAALPTEGQEGGTLQDSGAEGAAVLAGPDGQQRATAH